MGFIRVLSSLTGQTVLSFGLRQTGCCPATGRPFEIYPRIQNGHSPLAVVRWRMAGVLVCLVNGCQNSIIYRKSLFVHWILICTPFDGRLRQKVQWTCEFRRNWGWASDRFLSPRSPDERRVIINEEAPFGHCILFAQIVYETSSSLRPIVRSLPSHGIIL